MQVWAAILSIYSHEMSAVSHAFAQAGRLVENSRAAKVDEESSSGLVVFVESFSNFCRFFFVEALRSKVTWYRKAWRSMA